MGEVLFIYLIIQLLHYIAKQSMTDSYIYNSIVIYEKKIILDRPTVIYSSNKKLVFANVNLKVLGNQGGRA